MEKSWNFEIGAKSHGKVMEFDSKFLILMNRRHYAAAFQTPTNMYVDKGVMEFCDMVMEKSWNFVAKISWQPCMVVNISITENP